VADKTLTCSVLTPERAVLEAQAGFAALPAYDGEVGILPGRAPLLCRLGVGIVRLQTAGDVTRLFVDAGFAEVHDDKVTILTEHALAPEEVDVEAERAALAAARLRKATTPQAQQTRQRELARAATKIKLASAG